MIIEEKGYNCDRLSRGDKLVIGNGTYGYRGTIEENTANECVALNACCFYDKKDDGWRESVNMPNPLYAVFRVNGTILSERYVKNHYERLHLENGVFERETDYRIGNLNVKLFTRRFFLQLRSDLLVSDIRLSCSEECNIEVLSGIDCDVWNLNGKHFTVLKTDFSPLSVRAVTTEGKMLSVTVEENASQFPEKSFISGEKVLNRYNVSSKRFYLAKFCLLYREGAESLPLPENADFLRMMKENDIWWENKWKTSKVFIKDRDKLQTAVDYSIYQLISCAPKTEGVSVPARGLSGQTYKGAVFWDTEMFMVPFYLETDPDTAKRLMRYRIGSLNEARAKAKFYGYEGAFFAWESQDNGKEACSDFNVTDVFTGRPVKTCFKDKQIHISADIAVTLYNVYKATNDISLLAEGGCELIIECARFYYSRALYNHIKNRFELTDVLGPDEYHERVNNNAYTNYMAHETVRLCFKAVAALKRHAPHGYEKLYSKYAGDFRNLRNFYKHLYLPQPDEKGIIEQFDGYFALEDVSVEQVRSRLVNEKEYCGGTNGVATPTRVIKQADVIALMCVLPERFSVEVKKANYEFYLPYTEHGSSLSSSMYARCACMTGDPEEAYKYLKMTANVDLEGGGKKFAGSLYIGGSHPAACGGTWLTLSEGFLNKDYGQLPEEIEYLIVSTKKGTRLSRKKCEPLSSAART